MSADRTTTRTAYDGYLRASEPHPLQAPVSDTEGERSFLVVCQVQEVPAEYATPGTARPAGEREPAPGGGAGLRVPGE